MPLEEKQISLFFSLRSLSPTGFSTMPGMSIVERSLFVLKVLRWTKFSLVTAYGGRVLPQLLVYKATVARKAHGGPQLPSSESDTFYSYISHASSQIRAYTSKFTKYIHSFVDSFRICYSD